MENSAPVTWKSLLEKQMMYAMLFCTSCDMVEFPGSDLFNRRNSSDDEKSSHMEV
jgi:hypothetical protein